MELRNLRLEKIKIQKTEVNSLATRNSYYEGHLHQSFCTTSRFDPLLYQKLAISPAPLQHRFGAKICFTIFICIIISYNFFCASINCFLAETFSEVSIPLIKA